MAGVTIPVAKGDLEAAIGAAFKAARVAKGLSLLDTCKALGVSQNTVRWHEAGHTIMGPEPLFAAGTLFDVDPDTIGVCYRAETELQALVVAADAVALMVKIPAIDAPYTIHTEGP